MTGVQTCALPISKYRFCIGVQWHPEFLISEGDVRLFKAFLGAAASR